MRLAIFGLGYIGTVSAACLAELGHTVYCTDIAENKVDLISKGISSIFEPNLQDLLEKANKNERLFGTLNIDKIIECTDIAFICVGTPSKEDGSVDTTSLSNVIDDIMKSIEKIKPKIYSIVNRSTCLPETHIYLQKKINDKKIENNITSIINYYCHPEFLREGSAILDFFNPPKIIFGAIQDTSFIKIEEIYPKINSQIFLVDLTVAAIVKYADNIFHALKITFANEIGILSRSNQLDSRKVMELVVADKKLNISSRYLKPGNAFGGSCLPKDLRAIESFSRSNNIQLSMIESLIVSNNNQLEMLLKIIRSYNLKTIGLYGLSFKSYTDDLRESPYVFLAQRLIGEGFRVSIYDEYLSTQKLIGENAKFIFRSLPHLKEILLQNIEQVCLKSDLIIIGHKLSTNIDPIIFKSKKIIIDLSNNESLSSFKGYVGLYW